MKNIKLRTENAEAYSIKANCLLLAMLAHSYPNLRLN